MSSASSTAALKIEDYNVGGVAPVDPLATARAHLAQDDSFAALTAMLEAYEQDPSSDYIIDAISDLAESKRVAQASDSAARAYATALRKPFEMRMLSVAAVSCLFRRIACIKGDVEVALNDFDPYTMDLLVALLGNSSIQDIALEKLMLSIRTALLKSVVSSENGESLEPSLAALIEAMARHNFTNEYIWEETPEEAALLEPLHARIEAWLVEGKPVSASHLFTLGAYRDLAQIDIVRRWVASLAVNAPQSLDPTLRLLVFNPIWEAEIAKALPILTPIETGVSSAVRAQYEKNPYPRWRKSNKLPTLPYVAAIAQEIKPNVRLLQATADEPRVLVAGCGTGKHPIDSARFYRGAQVLAIDLSLASLSYAARQAAELGVMNIAFAQADILRLHGVDHDFDIVESAGVLHHMAQPEEGLRRLVAALKPGGYLKLALYSRAARRDITQARAAISSRGYASDLAGLRSFRRDYLAGDFEFVGKLERFSDFFLTSNLRDLVFHVQEHQFSLPEISAMLARNGLEFLGFRSLEGDVRRRYAGETPQDPMQTDLIQWDAFELRHPGTFNSMYNFWCRKI